MNAFLPDQTRISQVHLRTANLERALAFYTDVLGLKARHGRSQAIVSAAKGSPGLIVLSEDLNATPHPPRSTGLYHLALRYPRRQDLALAFRRLIKRGYPVAGASDHGVSEAIYISDADGNGVELYADRPRAEWSWRNGQVAMVTEPLDLDHLLATIEHRSAPTAPPAKLDLGHIHLHVADLAAAERFYREFLGLDVTQRSYPGALFLAAGGYHHHIGVNVWAGKIAPPPNSVGLLSYRLEVPMTEILYCLRHRAPLLGYETRFEKADPPLLQIRDPNGNWLEIQPSNTNPSTIAQAPCSGSEQWARDRGGEIGAGRPTSRVTSPRARSLA
ncbi:MAG TPA: VOC family protein [Candidatus Binatia bacterium]|jgi:catechol 2,3-dioxygenase|nr:VOC family protein [Candidatus Binatia bacterium]